MRELTVDLTSSHCRLGANETGERINAIHNSRPGCDEGTCLNTAEGWLLPTAESLDAMKSSPIFLTFVALPALSNWFLMEPSSNRLCFRSSFLCTELSQHAESSVNGGPNSYCLSTK